MAERRKFSIGEQDFANIRNSDMLYIGKTRLVYDLTCKSGRYFFFRPNQEFHSIWFESGMSSVDSDEVSTSDERIDLLMKTKNYVFILEFKTMI